MSFASIEDLKTAVAKKAKILDVRGEAEASRMGTCDVPSKDQIRQGVN